MTRRQVRWLLALAGVLLVSALGLAWRAQTHGAVVVRIPLKPPAAPAATSRAPAPLNPSATASAAPDERRPGRATPATAAEPGAWDIAWGDGDGRSYRTRIEIAVGEGLRRPAEVVTREPGEVRDLVRYAATAFRSTDGRLHVDARGARIAGDLSGEWSPDSFAIAPDGSVRIQDDQHQLLEGWVVQHSTTSPP